MIIDSDVANPFLENRQGDQMERQQRRKIGFIGVGVVGGAIMQVFSEYSLFDVVGYDKFREDMNDPSVVMDTEVVFVSVPTPTEGDTGEQDMLAIREVCSQLQFMNYPGVVVIKSTVLPRVCELLKHDFGLRIVHFPEFLKEVNPYAGFVEAEDHWLAGHPDDTAIVQGLLRCLSETVRIHCVERYEVTEAGKFLHNTFLATKVSFMNEIHAVAESLGVPYQDILKVVLVMGKVGESHTRVPGPDKRMGFSGMCFVKDTLSFATWARSIGKPLTILETAIKLNRKIRPTAYDGSERVGVNFTKEK